MVPAFLGLGSNVGDRRSHLQGVVDELRQSKDVYVVSASPVYETEAHTVDPAEEQRDYLNAVVEVEIRCTAKRLLRIAQDLEWKAGRERHEDVQWAPRSLDVDLLAVDEVTHHTDDLTLPHPRLAERRFVLRPWADLAPNFVVPPPFEATVRTLLKACSDTAAIRRTEEGLSVTSSPTDLS